MTVSDLSCKGVDPASARVRELHSSAQRRWPELQVSLAVFGQYLVDRPAAFNEDNECVQADDLYLACACLQGIPLAIRVLESDYLDPLLPRSGYELNRDDLRQAVLERLLAAEEPRQPRLADYSGRASLRTWLRVVTKRVQLNLLRKTRVEPTRDAEDLTERFVVPLGADPELDCMRLRYAREFKEAFRLAIRRLDARSTLVLRMHTIQGATGNEIATLFGVRRATVVRWMAEIRRELFSMTREYLREALRLSSTEFESIVRLVRSELDTNLSVLRETER